jgi:ubiquinone/menaquinone biosynthesis C-methylase UbiE
VTTVPALEAYRQLARRYDQEPNALLALNRRTLPGLFPDLEGRIVVDCAGGTGYWADWCAQRGARAIAADFCIEMLALARSPSVLADNLRLPFKSACVDIVVCSFGLGYAPSCIGELARIVRRGGAIIASDVHPEAIARGWTRSFRINGSSVAVEHEPYSLASLARPELHMEALLEPAFGEPERGIFENAGKLNFFTQAHPAIFAARWRRS